MNFESGIRSRRDGTLLGSKPRPPILVVDDEEAITAGLVEILNAEGYDLQGETSPERAVSALRQREFAAILSDQRMPGMSGLELLAEAKRLQPNATRILITGILCLDTVIEAINRGEIYRFLVKPWIREELLMSVRDAVQRHALLVQSADAQSLTKEENLRLQGQLKGAARQNEELATRNRLLEHSWHETIQVCIKTFELFLPSLGTQARVAHEVCLGMGEILSLDQEQRKWLEMSAWLHDAGLLHFPRAVIRKWQADPSTVSEEERKALERHPVLAESAARATQGTEHVAAIVRAHHERWDGNGYPDGRAREEIPWLARLFAVASFYAASQETPSQCAQRIQLQAGAAFDPEATRVFLAALCRVSMPRKQSEISVCGLRPGMKLAQGVYAHDGRLLLAAGQCLTSSTIEYVMNESRAGGLDEYLLVYC